MTEIVPDIIIEDDRWLNVCDIQATLSVIAAHPLCIRESGANSEITFSLLLTNDNKVQQLNRDFREKDKPTNVLSFPNDADDYLGDIAIAYETVIREAEEQDKSQESHFTHLVIHGFLHLCGHDHIDDAEAEEMESLEIKILEDMGIKNPYID